MVKVITYGTYDLLHYGHIKLLERAKALGDYLIVGVTADDFDKTRGKINVQQSLMERIEAVRATGLADKIIVEEYEGQKIDDIRRYDVDIFTVGSDWVGKFDYLNEYCKVVYLERTEGISSTELRSIQHSIRLGLVGSSSFLNKVYSECDYVNGVDVVAVCTDEENGLDNRVLSVDTVTDNYDDFLKKVDAVYIRSLPSLHYGQILHAIECGKHVLCESPIAVDFNQTKHLFGMANERGVVLMEGIKTAYSTAYQRLLLLIKSGKIGRVVSVDATCTSLKSFANNKYSDWPGFYEWAPTALLPIFGILRTNYTSKRIVSYRNNQLSDLFTKIDFVFEHAVASIKVGDGVKSEGNLIVSGTKGYIYVPAPWWKTDYFEVRYENSNENKRYFYQLEGEGIRYELVTFSRAIEKNTRNYNIEYETSLAISKIIEDYENGRKVTWI